MGMIIITVTRFMFHDVVHITVLCMGFMVVVWITKKTVCCRSEKLTDCPNQSRHPIIMMYANVRIR
jgi:hypothetical protein